MFVCLFFNFSRSYIYKLKLEELVIDLHTLIQFNLTKAIRWYKIHTKNNLSNKLCGSKFLQLQDLKLSGWHKLRVEISNEPILAVALKLLNWMGVTMTVHDLRLWCHTTSLTSSCTLQLSVSWLLVSWETLISSLLVY